MPSLVVVCARDDPVAAWLADDTLVRVEFQTEEPQDDAADSQLASILGECGLRAQRLFTRCVVRLPLDGPESCWAYAVGWLADQLPLVPDPSIVVVEAPDRGPPRSALLQVVQAAGLIPGVDLRPFAWFTESKAWLAGPGQTVPVRHRIPEHDEARALAALVAQTASPPLDSPSAQWLDAVAKGLTPGSSAEAWSTVLEACYIERQVRTLSSGEPDAL